MTLSPSPPTPEAAAFLTVKKLKVTLWWGLKFRSWGCDRKLTHTLTQSWPSCHAWLQPICQLTNRQLLHPKTSARHAPYWDIFNWCKTHLKSTTRPSLTRGGWCESRTERPLPASAPELVQRESRSKCPLWWKEQKATQKELTFCNLAHFMRNTFYLLLNLGNF